MKGIYQLYFGWFDGNPAALDPLPPEEEGRRYVEAMGGAEAVLANARRAFDAGDYRWAATILDLVVFADPGNVAAKALLARTYDQLGYQAESGPWRDVYLTGARELRHGVRPQDVLAAGSGLLEHVPLDLVFTAMATRLDGPRADGKDLTINFVFADVGRTIVVRLENAVLHHAETAADPDADATVTLTRAFWLRLVTRRAGLREMIFSNDFSVTGSRLKVLEFFRLLDRPEGSFPIVTPRRLGRAAGATTGP